jgi:hypothetical protein
MSCSRKLLCEIRVFGLLSGKAVNQKLVSLISELSLLQSFDGENHKFIALIFLWFQFHKYMKINRKQEWKWITQLDKIQLVKFISLSI